MAVTPPRLWPISETRDAVLWCIATNVSMSGLSMTSEYITLNATPARRGR